MSLINIQHNQELSEEDLSWFKNFLIKNKYLLQLNPQSDVVLGNIVIGRFEEEEFSFYSKFSNLQEEMSLFFYELFYQESKKNDSYRSIGEEFEKVLKENFDKKGKYYHTLSDVLFKNELADFNPEKTNFTLEVIGKKYLKTKRGTQAPPKSDILIIASEGEKNKSLGVSVKKTPSRTQVSVHSIDSFIAGLTSECILEIPEIVKKALSKFCGLDGFTPQELEPERIVKQQDRQRYLLNELEETELSELIDWCEKNKTDIANFVLFTGSLEDEIYHAKYIIATNDSYTGESSQELPDLVVESKQDILNKIKDTPVSLGRDYGTVKFGADLSFQMKGSGSTRSMKTSLQFQKQANPLKTKD